MRKQDGFTVLELVAAIIFLAIAGTLVVTQKTQLEQVSHDRERKTAINAMYYSLEEVYYKTNNSYPRTISPSVLPSIDPDLFKDPAGKSVGEQDSTYFYDPLNCEGDVCKSYRLRADLENEADYIKSSLH